MFKFLGVAKVKLYAAIGIAFAVLLAWSKYLSNKVDKLEHKEKVRDKIDEIDEQQEIDQVEVLVEEKERINERIEEIKSDPKPKSRRDRASRL